MFWVVLTSVLKEGQPKGGGNGLGTLQTEGAAELHLEGTPNVRGITKGKGTSKVKWTSNGRGTPKGKGRTGGTPKGRGTPQGKGPTEGDGAAEGDNEEDDEQMPRAMLASDSHPDPTIFPVRFGGPECLWR